ncbi:hypothetical protein AB1Y20_004979 [Prymnesium parvum]|uniref:Fe2OG dioxygenase domain-containing protein n=1 Tax=Prymnesium parvum TaxID=97485 RepID=A0AB34J2W0_PRYPA
MRSMRRLPLLDIARWRNDPHGFAGQLRTACHLDGFFMLRHDLPSSLTERLFAEARRFFSLPAEAKRTIEYSHSPAFRGYMRCGLENTAGRPDLREQVEIAAEAPACPPGAWPPYLRLRGPNQWPEAQPSLRDAVEEYADRMSRVSSEVTDALCLALQLDRAALDALLFDGEPHWQLKLASYQPVEPTAGRSEDGAAAASIGVGEHTDSGFLTLLLQDDVGGLQAFTQGEWVDVPPSGLGVLVCNLGEVAQLVSGGYLLATPHRVLSGPSARLSVPFFFNPTLTAKVSPIELPSTLKWERDEQYAETSHWRRPNNTMLTDYGLNAFKSLARSHQAVFHIYHGDLEVLEDGRVVSKTN